MPTMVSNELELFVYMIATLAFNGLELFHLIVLENISDKVMYKLLTGVF